MVEVVRDGNEVANDAWYRTPWACWRAVGDGSRRGVPGFAVLGPTIADRAAGALRRER